MNVGLIVTPIVIVAFLAVVGLVILFASKTNTKSEILPVTEYSKYATHIVVNEEPQLQHVALLFRHTVRAPRVFPPNDEILRPELFPRGIQRCTRKGLIATRNATLNWKELYQELFTGNPDEVYARSSQASRCYETLSMMVNTWYPSPDDLPLSQVAIRMPPKGTDKYVENCGSMKYILRDYDPNYSIADSIYNEEGFRTVGDYVDFLRNQTNLLNNSVNFFYMAYMEGFVSVDFENAYHRSDHWMLKYPKTREFTRLYLLDCSINVMAPYYGHFLMNGIAEKLELAAQKVIPYKLSLFCFHDLNLLSVLRALGITNKAADPLAVIAFELWKDPDGYRVAIRMSEGLTTAWEYRPAELLKIRNRNAMVERLSDFLPLLRNHYKDQLNLTDCGFFGPDAKV